LGEKKGSLDEEEDRRRDAMRRGEERRGEERRGKERGGEGEETRFPLLTSSWLSSLMAIALYPLDLDIPPAL